MLRMRLAIGVIGLLTMTATQAGGWRVGDPTLIDAAGRRPSLWSGTVAYTLGTGGHLYLFDGTGSAAVYTDGNCYEPRNVNGAIAWRDFNETTSVNDIFQWDGIDTDNVSQSPVVDSDVTAGSNGDVMWSRNHQSLWYYTAATDTAADLGIPGVHPCLYIAEGGVATYAYQDPDTNVVKYFDGTTTHDLGPGTIFGAFPTVWDGAVVWVGEGVGAFFAATELFYWKDGTTIRITDDDAAGGFEDRSPSFWNGVLVWTRYPGDAFAPKLYVWDGVVMEEISATGGGYPSLHEWQVAWVDVDGLVTAPLHLNGDLNCDGIVDFDDIDPFVAALSCQGGELDCWDTICPWANADCNCDNTVNFDDIDPFVAVLSTGDSSCRD